MTLFPPNENTDENIADDNSHRSAQRDQAAADVGAMSSGLERAYGDDSEVDRQPTAIADELAAEKDRVLRLQAEMENLRSRTAREINDERRYAPLSVVRDLLPVVDNIDRAIEAANKQMNAAQQNNESASLLEGIMLVRQQLMSVLEQHHCHPIEAVGQPFDPQVHEAIMQQPSDEQPANHVLQQTQVGYQLHDRVVRPSQVIISTGPANSE